MTVYGFTEDLGTKGTLPEDADYGMAIEPDDIEVLDTVTVIWENE